MNRIVALAFSPVSGRSYTASARSTEIRYDRETLFSATRFGFASDLKVVSRHAAHASEPSLATLSREEVTISQTAMNIAAITGPMTKPLIPKIAIPPRVAIRMT